MNVKDMRNLLKGLKGDIEVEEGMMHYYTPEEYKDALNFDLYRDEIMNPEIDRSKIKRVIFWMEE